MPIYEFECRQCGHVWDELLKLSDPDPDACSKCAQPAVQRRMTAAAFRLKGGGWYETDFKKDGDTKRNLVESGGSSAPAAPAATSEGGTSSEKSTPPPAATPAPSSDSA